MKSHAVVADVDRPEGDDDATRALHAAMERGIARLISLVSNNAGMQYIVDAISEIFGMPASIIDNNFTFLALSRDYPDVFSAFGDDLSKGYLPLEIQQMLQHSEIFHPSRTRTEPVYFDVDVPDGTVSRNYVTLIYLKHVPVASFSFFTKGEEIPRAKLRYLPTIASLLSIEMQKSNFYLLNKITFYSHLLVRLLDETTAIDDEAFRLRFAVFGHRLEQYKQVVLVDLHNEDFDAAGVQSFADKFQPHFPNSVYFIDNGDVIYLTSSAQYEPISPQDADVLQQDVSAANLCIGISSVFEGLSQFAQALCQARCAIETGVSLAARTHVLRFDQYRLADLIRHLPRDLDLSTYVYPPLHLVLDHDRDHGTQLTYTLSRYLLNPAHPRAVCQELFIHKNTLYYRLSQLRAIMHTDLDSTEVRTQIYLSLLVLQAQHRLDFSIDRVPDEARLVGATR